MKAATLFALDGSLVAQVEVDPDFYGYPGVILFDNRPFVFVQTRSARMDPVNSATHEAYHEATTASVTAWVPQKAAA